MMLLLHGLITLLVAWLLSLVLLAWLYVRYALGLYDMLANELRKEREERSS